MQKTCEKQIKHIDSVKGTLIRPCPCAKNHVSCGYVVISHILNCPFNCSYCFLNSYFGKDEIVVFKDEDRIIKETQEYMERLENPLRIGTGQYSDSLALPDAVSLAKKLIKLFSEQNKHFFELKTKSNNVDGIIALNHNGQTVVSWSLNPQKIIDLYESDSADLQERLSAAKKCVDADYRVAFHFDPIIYFDGWQDEYKSVVDQIFDSVRPNDIAWISLGALRLPLKFRSVFDMSLFERGLDNKMRYPEQLRIQLFSWMINFIRSHSSDIYVYLCMETAAVWEKVKICYNNIKCP